MTRSPCPSTAGFEERQGKMDDAAALLDTLVAKAPSAAAHVARLRFGWREPAETYPRSGLRFGWRGAAAASTRPRHVPVPQARARGSGRPRRFCPRTATAGALLCGKCARGPPPAPLPEPLLHFGV